MWLRGTGVAQILLVAADKAHLVVCSENYNLIIILN
jgi:hypothetical protein